MFGIKFLWVSDFLIISGNLNINEDEKFNSVSIQLFFVQKGKEFINDITRIVYYFKTD